jgi:hypothetical protein
MFVSVRENLIIQNDNLKAALVIKFRNLNLKLKLNGLFDKKINCGSNKMNKITAQMFFGIVVFGSSN